MLAMYYHASPIGGIQQLTPHVSNHQKALVYLTSKRENALVYLSNAVEKHCRETGFVHEGGYYKWASYGFNRDGLLVLEEYWPNAIQETYAGVSGYIYRISRAPAAQKQADIPFAFTSAEPVDADGYEWIPDAWQALQDAAAQGLIVLQRYEENSEKMLLWIENTIRKEYAGAQERPEYQAFLCAKFPQILKGSAEA